MSLPTLSSSHLVLIPSYNTGSRLVETVRTALTEWRPVWVVIDGSTDGSDRELEEQFGGEPGVRILRLPKNVGKGSALRHGLAEAAEAGFSYALTMDADGQHPVSAIRPFMECSAAHPEALILGQPHFGVEAPPARVFGHQFAAVWIQLETGWGGVGDSLFGFRVYPIQESLRILDAIWGGRGYDVDTELLVRLYWRGYLPIRRPVAVRYFTSAEGGVSHFRYGRDNLLLIRTHAILLLQAPWRLWRRRSLAKS